LRLRLQLPLVNLVSHRLRLQSLYPRTNDSKQLHDIQEGQNAINGKTISL
jgi:hypothetical protein